MAEESYNEYKDDVLITNKKWEKFENGFFPLFKSFDYNDESRVIFINLKQGFIHKTNSFKPN